VDDLLNWDPETQGDYPEEFSSLPIDDVRAAVAARMEAAATEREAQILERVRADQERARLQTQSAAQAQTDIEFYTSIRDRKASGDTDLIAAALADEQADEARYLRGAAALNQQSQNTAQAEALRNFVGASQRELVAAGIVDALPEIGDTAGWAQLQTRLGAYEGKGGLFAYLIDYGRNLGAQSSQDDTDRQGRINANVDGSPNLGSGAPPTKVGDYTNRAWVESMQAADPEWSFKMSDDGKLTNGARVREAVVRSMRGRR
jgi:hypothetical protein